MMSVKRIKRQKGFSLIELMVTVAIIGIIVGVAIPSYQEHVERVGYTEAKSTLQHLMKTMEDYYLANNLSYSSDLNEVTGSAGVIKTSSGKYSITAAQCSDGSSGSVKLSDCVQLEAKSEDGRNLFTINSRGFRSFNGADGWPN